MTTTHPAFLRHIVVALGATCLLGATDVRAQATATLGGTTGNTCKWTSMSMTPSGSISITCDGNPPPPPPPPPPPTTQATFTLTGPSTVSVNTYPSFKIKRTGGTAAQVGFGYGVTGSGCGWMSQGPFFLANNEEYDLGVFPIAAGTCSISFGVEEGHLASPASREMTITVSTSPPPPPPPPPAPPPDNGWSQPIPVVAGCPAADPSARLRVLKWPDVMRAPTKPGDEHLNSAMDSGEVMAIRIPQSPSGRASVTLTQGQGTVTPAQPISELTVSRCPGVIETNLPNNTCYAKTTSINYYAITAYNRALPGRGTDQGNYWDGCLIPNSGEQYYINVRWQFKHCPFGTRQCAFTLQWAEGPN